MYLQGKTLFIWQIKVAKTAKAKLCATNIPASYPRIRLVPDSEVLARGTCKKKIFLMPTQSSVPQPKANYPRIRHSRITLCVFAGKNAVYLANQSCKDGKSKALCHKYTASYPRIRLVPDSEVLARGTSTKKSFFDANTKLCAIRRI